MAEILADALQSTSISDPNIAFLADDILTPDLNAHFYQRQSFVENIWEDSTHVSC